MTHPRRLAALILGLAAACALPACSDPEIDSALRAEVESASCMELRAARSARQEVFDALAGANYRDASDVDRMDQLADEIDFITDRGAEKGC